MRTILTHKDLEEELYQENIKSYERFVVDSNKLKAEFDKKHATLVMIYINQDKRRKAKYQKLDKAVSKK